MSDSVTFKGIRNGRPEFDFGGHVPPKWLIEMLDGRNVEGDELVLRSGERLKPGAVVRK